VDIVYLLVPLSVVAVFAIGALFIRAAAGGQFEDLDEAGRAILADDPADPRNS
jgi:cbb3-type cytochrome oxidase maturation protein